MAEGAIQPHVGTTIQPQLQQQPVTQNTGLERRDKYKKILYGLGVTELISGIACIVLAVVAIIIAATNFTSQVVMEHTGYYYERSYHGFTYASQGIWCGLFLVVTGTLGINAKSIPSVCMYNANMAMTITSACLMVPLMVLSAIAAAIENASFPYGYHIPSLVGIHSVIVVIGFVAGILCIVHSAYCCAAVCVCQQQRRGPVMFPAQPYANHQMVLLQNGQYVPVQMQPYPVQGHQFANVQMAGAQVAHQPPQGQVVYQPPQGQVVMPQMAMQLPPGQTIAPSFVPQGQGQPPSYYPQPTQPPQSVPQQVQYPVGPAAPPSGSNDAPTQIATEGFPVSKE